MNTWDYSKLKGRIVEVCGTRSNFAKLMESTERTISLKLNGKRGFTQKEIKKALYVLDLTNEDITTYFFTEKV